MKKPKLIQPINLDSLLKVCYEHIESFENGKYHEDNDDEHFIYEAAMETFYGKDIWKYINSKI